MANLTSPIHLLDRRFEKGVTIALIPLGLLLILLAGFVFFIVIPTDTTGIWASADGWKKILVLETLISSIVVGTIFLVVSPSLLYLAARTAPGKPVDPEFSDSPPARLRAWALLQFVAAAILLSLSFITWYSIDILGGPSGFSHYVPPEYLLLSLIIEVPTLLLALLTWICPHRIHWTAWIAIGALHILAAVFVFRPWVYPTRYYALPLWQQPTLDKLAEFLGSTVIVGGTVLLIPTFTKLETKDISPILKTYGLAASILGLTLIIVSSYYLWLGIYAHLVNIPLLAEFPSIGDELRTVRLLMILPSLFLAAGIALLALGTHWYLQNDTVVS
ncbi:MAG: hypothetical protein ACFFCO_05275 [Promethearchaeota archaeon]